MGIVIKKRWQSILVAFVFAFTSVSTLLTSDVFAITGDIEPWETTQGSLAIGKSSVGVVALNGYLYSIGGRESSNSSPSTSVEYSQVGSNGAINSWTNTTSLPEGIMHATTAFTANEYIYVVGGVFYPNTNTFLTKIYYTQANNDGSLKPWTTSSTTATRGGPAVITSGSYIYLIGGEDTERDSNGENDKNPPALYAKINNDGTVSPWQLSSVQLPKTMIFSNAVTYGGYIYIMGGISGFQDPIAHQDIYVTTINNDGSINSWSNSNQTLPEPTAYSATAIINGILYLIGGSDTTSALTARSTVYFSSINNAGVLDAWQTSLNNLPTPKTGISATTLSNKIYVIGGWGANADSTSSTSIYFTNLTPQTLAAPTNLSATSPTKQKPTLSWSAVTGATSYTVYRNGAAVGTSATTSFTDSGLSTDGNYSYTVAASNSSISSPQSTPISVQYDSTLPAANNGTINGWLVINWGNPVITADVSDALSGVTGGEYYIDNDPGQGNGTPMTYANNKINAQPIITTGTTGGWHTIYMRSKDTAGNWSTPTSVRFFFF